MTGRSLHTARTHDTFLTPAWLPRWALDVLGLNRWGLDPCGNPDSPLFDPGMTERVVLLPEYRDRLRGAADRVIWGNGLDQDWSAASSVWLNPPYSELPKAPWSAKFVEEVRLGVALLPVRTASAWWQDDVDRAAVVTLLRKRVTHHGMKSGAPFGQALIFVGPDAAASHWARAAIDLGSTSVRGPLESGFRIYRFCDDKKDQ